MLPPPSAMWIDPPADDTISCQEAGNYVLIPTNLNYTNYATGSCLVEGSAVGLLAGAYDECGGTLTQTWTYTDDCNNTIQHVQTVNVMPAPVAAWINPPADTTVS